MGNLSRISLTERSEASLTNWSMPAEEEAAMMRSWICVGTGRCSALTAVDVWKQRVDVGGVKDKIEVKVGLFFRKEGLVLACRCPTIVVFVFMVQCRADFGDKIELMRKVGGSGMAARIAFLQFIAARTSERISFSFANVIQGQNFE